MAKVLVTVAPEVMPDDHLKAIGMITYKHATLDYAMENVIWGLLGLDILDGRCLTPHIAARVRMDIIKSLVHQHFSQTTPEAITKLAAISSRMDAVTKSRNDSVHGLWVKGNGSNPMRIVSKARGKPVAYIEALDSKTLMAEAVEIEQVTNDFLALFLDLGVITLDQNGDR
jgi:hypothetical protein